MLISFPQEIRICSASSSWPHATLSFFEDRVTLQIHIPCTATGYLATNTSLLASVLTCPGLGLPVFCKYPCLFSFQRLLIYPKAKLFLLLNVVEH